MEISKETMYKGVAAGTVLAGALGYAAMEAPNAYPWSDTAHAETHCVYEEGTSQAQFKLNYQNDEPWNSGKDIAVELSVDGKVVDHIEDAKPIGKGTDGSVPTDEYLKDNTTKPVEVIYSSAPVGLKKLVLKRTWVNPKFGKSPDTESIDLPAVEKDCKPETPPPTNPPVVKRPPVDNGGVITPTTQPEAEPVPPTPAVGIDTAISETAPALPNTGGSNHVPEKVFGGIFTGGVGAELVRRFRSRRPAVARDIE